MKFKLFKELLRSTDIISHVFLNSIPSELSCQIADGTERLKKSGKTLEWITENREVDLTLTIEGVEVDVSKFFNSLYDQYEKMVKSAAAELVKEQTSDRLEEIRDKISMMSEAADSLAEDINWNVDNIFEKKE